MILTKGEQTVTTTTPTRTATTSSAAKSTARKATTRAPRVSPEERLEQANALQENIAAQVEQLRDTDQWRRFLAFTASFHNYSLGNLLLILSQRPDATAVAGFRSWQARGRQVRKGEKAIRIFGFAQRTVTADEHCEEGESAATNDAGQKVIRYYPMAPDCATVSVSLRLA